METVCFEMATYVSRTATTPILNQSNERNATILDAQGRLAALSVGIPQFMLSSTLPVRFALEFFEGELYPGDVIVANDPYHGGGHLPDFNVFAPVFDADGELLLIASIQCHHGDTGGALAGGYNVFAKDIWSEGTRYPLLKIVDAGKERRDVVLTMRANNRLAGFIGDLRSQVGAAQLGVAPARRDHRALRRRHRARRGRLDDRRRAPPLRRRDQHAGPTAPTRPTSTSTPTRPATPTSTCTSRSPSTATDLIVDFAGSDDRPEIQAWSTYGNTRGYTIAQLASLVDPTIPKNEGFFDCIELRVPRGHVREPASRASRSRSGTHHPGVEVGDAIAIAMSADPPRPVRAADLQVRQPPPDVGRRATRAPASRSSTTAARSTPAG